MRKALIIGAALAVSACSTTPKTLYTWGDYQKTLINYAKDSDEAAFEAGLRTSIDLAEADSAVPPGLYAELGYLLYANGNVADATPLFIKERELFPESTILMDKLIGGTSQSAQGAVQ